MMILTLLTPRDPQGGPPNPRNGHFWAIFTRFGALFHKSMPQMAIFSMENERSK